MYILRKLRSFNVNAAYISILIACGKIDKADIFYHEMFDHECCQLSNGQYIGVNNEPIIIYRA
jgi:hypothetical protein